MSALLKQRATLAAVSLDKPPTGVVMLNEVTRKTFKRHVETHAYFAASDKLGYERQYQKGETLAGSPSVSFHRGILDGRKCWILHCRWNREYMVFQLSKQAEEHNKQYS